MKKTYIAPVNEIDEMGVENLICQSANYDDNNNATSGDGSTGVNDVQHEGDALGRRKINAWEEW